MKRRRFLYGVGGLAGSAAMPNSILPTYLAEMESHSSGIIGMYVHQHWSYNHPYSARTWTIDDYMGYADGLTKLGYNTMLIWPMLETMPQPLTSSDKANLEKISKVIDLLHKKFKMQVWIPLCPNVAAKDHEAAKYTFAKRSFFSCDMRVNPGDPSAVQKMIQRREELLRPLAQVDAITIIDSDPGGYPKSTNAEFVNLFREHRAMLDRLRPGIMLYYWMHAGWEAYCRFYETGEFKFGTAEEAEDVLIRLKKLNPEPWGITVNTLSEFYPKPYRTHLAIAEKVGLASRAVGFSYGAIEGEPSFPLTNFGGNGAFNAGRTKAPRGVMGNAQTHCVQLPNTFAMARGATGEDLVEADYVEFADELLSGQGAMIVEGWHALGRQDSEHMREAAKNIQAMPSNQLTPGALGGLLFGDPKRFINDLILELRCKASFCDFVIAVNKNEKVKQALSSFLSTTGAWQQQTGYSCAWYWPDLTESLRKLNSSAINAILDEKGRGKTPYDRIANKLLITETYTPRLLNAMAETLKTM